MFKVGDIVTMLSHSDAQKARIKYCKGDYKTERGYQFGGEDYGGREWEVTDISSEDFGVQRISVSLVGSGTIYDMLDVEFEEYSRTPNTTNLLKRNKVLKISYND